MQTLSQYVIAWLAHFFVFAFVYFADTKSHRQIDCKTREFRKFFVTHILIYLVTLFQFLTIKLIFLLICIEIEMTALIIVAVTSWFMNEILFFSIQSWKICIYKMILWRGKPKYFWIEEGHRKSLSAFTYKQEY